MTSNASGQPSGSKWGALFGSALARAAIGFQFQSLPALAPVLAVSLGLGLTEVGSLTGAYMAPGVVVALLTGLILQRVNGFSVLMAGLCLMVLSGFVAFFAGDFADLLIARLMGGTGGVLVTVATLKGVFDQFSEAELPLASGVIGGAQPLGMGFALLIFSMIGQNTDWAFGILSTSGVAIVALFIAWVFIPAVRQEPANAGSGGMVAMTGAAWLRLILSGLAIMLFVGSFFGFLSFFPSFLQAAGWKGPKAGWALAALGWAPIVMGPFGGYLAYRLGRPTSIAAIGITIWGSAVCVTALSEPTVWLLALMILFGPLSIGIVMSISARAVEASAHGLASGVSMAFMFFGMAAMPALAPLVGEVFASTTEAQVAVAVLFCGVAFLCTLLPFGLFEWLNWRRR